MICDGETIYSSGAFTKADEVGGNPDFGFGVVTAIPNITANFPAVWVDGDFLDFAHGFEGMAARLRLSEDDVIFGECDHPGIPIP